MSPARYTPKQYQAAPPSRTPSKVLVTATCLGAFIFITIGLSWLISTFNQSSTSLQVADSHTAEPLPDSLPTPSPAPSANPASSPYPPGPTPTQPTVQPQSAPTPSSTIMPDVISCQPSPSDTLTTWQIIDAAFINWHIQLQDGSQNWSDYPQLTRIWWQTLNRLACTPFLASALDGHTLTITANDLGMWWGQYDGQYQEQINLATQNASLAAYPSHIQQNIVHELTHVWRDTHYNDLYQDFANNLCGRGTPTAYISNYGATNCSEDFSEAVGYYVIRSATEWQTSTPYCPNQNPYDLGQAATFNWIRTNIFNGQTFGPPPPTSPQPCL